MAVAKTLIRKAEAAGCDITHLQLQQMLYFGHALLLGCYGRALLDTEFPAWRYGPVMPAVYRVFKSCGDLPIAPGGWTDNEQYDAAENEVIQAVIDRCQGLHGFTLVRMAHTADGPWAQVWQENRRNARIPNRRIRDYYRRYYQNGDA